MKNPNESRRRWGLTLWFSVIIFLYMLLSIFIAGAVVLILIRYNILIPKNLLQRPERMFLTIAVFSIVLGAILSFFVGKFPLKPVNAIIDAMNRLSRGDFKTRMHFTGLEAKMSTAREVEESFNHMAEELEETEMLRGDFINNFSHEFKTPIVSIAGFAKLLREGGITEAQKREYINIIAEESMRLSDMATNVLNLTKIENQTILTDVTNFNISEQIRAALLLLERKWTEKNVELEVDFNEYYVNGNEEQMKLVWINLLDNAIKYVNPGGILAVQITETPSDMIISVSNTGSEIPKDKLDRIFNKFYQADESHAALGNGIGLSIVKAVVELHKGKVVASSGSGKTVFTVVLPK